MFIGNQYFGSFPYHFRASVSGQCSKRFVNAQNNIILRVNESFTALTGYASSEVVGKTTKILISDKHNARFYQDILKTLQNEKSWVGEVWSKRKDGVKNP